MKELHRARVVAIGSEEDMAAVCRTLLANCDWLEIPDDRPPYSLEELRQQVKQHAEELGGEESGFYYGMVARYTYGDADNRTCRFDIARQPSGLWTACFHYDGETPFQSEDWLYLHVAYTDHRVEALGMLVLLRVPQLVDKIEHRLVLRRTLQHGRIEKKRFCHRIKRAVGRLVSLRHVPRKYDGQSALCADAFDQRAPFRLSHGLASSRLLLARVP